MLCPKDGSSTIVIDSRFKGNGNKIRRRRECLKCHYRFTTEEGFLHQSDQLTYETIPVNAQPDEAVLPDVPPVGKPYDPYGVFRGSGLGRVEDTS